MKLGDLSTRHVVSVAPQDSVDQAIAIMEEHGVHHLPVVSGRQVVGIVSDRDIVIGWNGDDPAEGQPAERGQKLASGVVEDIMSQPVFTLSPDDALRSATWLMINRRVHAIPLIRSDQLVGIVTESDLLRGAIASPEFSLHNNKSFLQQSVVDYMGSKVTTVGLKTSLHEAVDIMHAQQIRHLPVVFGDELLGIVSDRDVRRALGRSSYRDAEAQETGEFYLGPTDVQHVMTKDIQTIPSSATTEKAIEVLLRHTIHSLPIVDARRLVGIITDTDLLRAIGAEDKEGSV